MVKTRRSFNTLAEGIIILNSLLQYITNKYSNFIIVPFVW